MRETYDVVVVGGGAAGLSAALVLGRARRSVLVVDAGTPRNAPAGHVHNYLTRDGTPPADLLSAGRAEVERYGGEFVSGTAVSAEAADRTFRIVLDDGRTVLGRRLLVTTGLTDELPEVPGLAERWGRDVLHCPYCHGWEVRDRPIGILATGPLSMHQATMWRQWTPDLTLFTHVTGGPDDEERERLDARGVRVVDGEVTGLEVSDDRLAGVRLGTGEVVPVEALVIQSRLTARSDLLASLGLKPTDLEMRGHRVGTRVESDPTGATTVPGLYLAGNVTDLMAQVITSAAAGLTVAAAINADLITEDTDAAVAARRDLFSQPFWEERYRAHHHVWSGRPNAQLVAEAAELPSGSALDAGCGEGADAIWLAARGWRVTAADFAATALDRAAGHADAAGVGDRVTWTRADLTTWTPPERYDLVTAQFVHLPAGRLRDLVARLAEAVAPGGTLLIVGHHPSDLETTARRLRHPDLLFTADEVGALLDPDRWEILVAAARPRPAADPDGTQITVHDTVLRARRRTR